MVILKDRSSNQQEVAIFGEILADVFPDKTITGGAPFNVARHLNAFHMHPVLITRTGDDALKKILLEEFKALDLDPIAVQCDPIKPTGQVLVTLDCGQPQYEILDDQAYDHIHSGMAHLSMMAINPDIKYFGTLAQRSLHSRLALDSFLNDKPCPTFLDLNLREPWYNEQMIAHSLERCHYAKMNVNELRTIAELLGLHGKNDQAIARALQDKFGSIEVIVTCGEDGSWAIDQAGEYTEHRSKNTNKIIDTVGAGDAFSAVYLLGALHQWPIVLRLERANAFACAMCEVNGAAPASLDFYDQFIESWAL